MGDDWIVAGYNCTADPSNMKCTFDDVGEGLEDLFTGIGVPLGTLLIIVGIAGAVVAIMYGIAKTIGNGLKQ